MIVVKYIYLYCKGSIYRLCLEFVDSNLALTKKRKQAIHVVRSDLQLTFCGRKLCQRPCPARGVFVSGGLASSTKVKHALGASTLRQVLLQTHVIEQAIGVWTRQHIKHCTEGLVQQTVFIGCVYLFIYRITNLQRHEE